MHKFAAGSVNVRLFLGFAPAKTREKNVTEASVLGRKSPGGNVMPCAGMGGLDWVVATLEGRARTCK